MVVWRKFEEKFATATVNQSTDTLYKRAAAALYWLPTRRVLIFMPLTSRMNLGLTI